MTPKIKQMDILDFFKDANTRTNALVRGLQNHATKPHEKRTINKLFSKDFLGKLLGITDERVKQLVKDGTLPCEDHKRSNNSIRFTQDEILKALVIRGVLPKPTPGKPISIPICQFKGGTGKTTAAVNLSVFLSLAGYKVMFVDLDPQGSGTEALWSGNPNLLPYLELSDTAYQALSPSIPLDEKVLLDDLALPTAWKNLNLVPACRVLDNLNTEMTIHSNQISTNEHLLSELHQTLKTMELAKDVDTQQLIDQIRTNINQKSIRSGYRHWESLDNEIKKITSADIVIVDCQPSINPMTLNAVFSGDVLCMPVSASMLDVSSYDQFLNSMKNQFEGISELGGTKQIIPRILISNYDGQVLDKVKGSLYEQLEKSTSANKSIASKDTLIRTFMQTNLDEYLIQQPILRSDATKEASNHFKTVFELDLNELDDEGKKKHTVTPKTLKRATQSFESFGLEMRDIIESIK